MPYSLDDKLVIAISTRALFDLEAENAVFDSKGIQEYRDFQLARLEIPANLGIASPLVRKLLAFNQDGETRVEVVLLSRNDPVSGLRAFNSAKHHSLAITRGAFTRGEPPYIYLKALNAKLFLSADAKDVRKALGHGIPAARVYAKPAVVSDKYPDQVRIAFDGDSVLFGDESECVYKEEGLEAFRANETANAKEPLAPGPFKSFLDALWKLKSRLPENSIRTALITARDVPAHERAIRTLMEWKVEVDEAFFLGGLEKADFLAAFQPDFFFDDQTSYCEPASRVTGTGHVDYGVANQLSSEPTIASEDEPNVS